MRPIRAFWRGIRFQNLDFSRFSDFRSLELTLCACNLTNSKSWILVSKTARMVLQRSQSIVLMSWGHTQVMAPIRTLRRVLRTWNPRFSHFFAPGCFTRDFFIEVRPTWNPWFFHEKSISDQNFHKNVWLWYYNHLGTCRSVTKHFYWCIRARNMKKSWFLTWNRK